MANNEVSEQQAIGIFDSGVGGLTVLRTLLSAFPNETFIYLGDTARVPYGSKSAETIATYVDQNISYLLSHRVKAIIIACNSASSVVNDSTIWPVPIYEVIRPGATTAVSVSQNRVIGVIGTRATIAGKAYVHAIEELSPHTKVFQQACPLLVPLVEEGWENDPLTNLIVYRYLNPMKELGIDTLILGCTHYPILKESIYKVMGPNIVLVDSAQAIAQLLSEDFRMGRLKPAAENSKKPIQFRLYSTDKSDTFTDVATKIMSPWPIEEPSHVDLSSLINKNYN